MLDFHAHVRETRTGTICAAGGWKWCSSASHVMPWVHSQPFDGLPPQLAARTSLAKHRWSPFGHRSDLLAVARCQFVLRNRGPGTRGTTSRSHECLETSLVRASARASNWVRQ